MRRRSWLLLLLAFGTGCSGTNTAKKAKKPHARAGNRRKKEQTMDDMLIDSYIDDLKQGSVAKQLTAARELGEMGTAANAALPALERLVEHADESLSAAAKQAIESIRK